MKISIFCLDRYFVKPRGDADPAPGLFSRVQSAGFTLVELLVVISIIAVLVAIILPVFSKVKAGGDASKCISNQRQTGVLLAQFAADNDNYYPHLGNSNADSWTKRLAEYFPNDSKVQTLANTGSKNLTKSIFFCPAHKNKILRGGISSTDYAVNYHMFNGTQNRGYKLLMIPTPQRTMVLVDGSDELSSDASSIIYNPKTLEQGWPYTGSVHRETANLLFVDGHVETRKFPTDISKNVQVELPPLE